MLMVLIILSLITSYFTHIVIFNIPIFVWREFAQDLYTIGFDIVVRFYLH